ncbi:MAG TPA: ferritin-like domain-containing protein [Gemmatimonadaceae bacterium]
MADRRSAISVMPFTSTSPASAGPAEVLAALQFLLQVEYLQAALYAGAATPGLVPTTDATVYTTLTAHSTKHLSLITELITTRAALPAPSPVFDFTVKGAFPGFAFAAGQYATLQMLTQIVEDFAVRCYLGQLGVIAADKVALNTVVTILTVEARHASQVRRLRATQGWITGNSRGDLPAFAQAVYDGEDNVQQGTVNVTSVASGFGEVAGATQAFDEPLSAAQASAILTLFVV